MIPAEKQAMRERLVDAEYDLWHSCEEFEYHRSDNRCYSYYTGAMCLYEPKCHSENHEGKHYRLVAQEAILKDLSAALDEIDRLEGAYEKGAVIALDQAHKILRLDAENKRLRKMLKSWMLWGEGHTNQFDTGGELTRATRAALERK